MTEMKVEFTATDIQQEGQEHENRVEVKFVGGRWAKDGQISVFGVMRDEGRWGKGCVSTTVADVRALGQSLIALADWMEG